MAETFADGIEQHGMKRSAVEREMSRRITCIQSRRFAVNELPESAEKAKLLGLDSDGGQCGAESKLIEPLHRMRKEIEPDAKLFELAGRFIDFGANPMLVKVERRREATDAGTDDHHMMLGHGSNPSMKLTHRTDELIADYSAELSLHELPALADGKLGDNFNVFGPFELCQAMRLQEVAQL